MKRKTYNQLLEKLNKYIYNDRTVRSVSPNSDVSGVSASGIPFINMETDFNVLSDNQLTLVHSLLHKFYSQGGTKELEKSDIEHLHKIIRGKIKHEKDFDVLDKNDSRENN